MDDDDLTICKNVVRFFCVADERFQLESSGNSSLYIIYLEIKAKCGSVYR